MSYALEIQQEAVIDIQEAFEWYEIQKAGLGFEFIEEVENALANISDHPKFYTAINRFFRRIKIKRFPYLIIYEIENDLVIINSVPHARKKPKL